MKANALAHVLSPALLLLLLLDESSLVSSLAEDRLAADESERAVNTQHVSPRRTRFWTTCITHICTTCISSHSYTSARCVDRLM
jgi:hypothetical protein